MVSLAPEGEAAVAPVPSPKSYAAILNTDGGTLRTTDCDALAERLQLIFAEHGHRIECRLVAGDQIEARLAEAFSSDDFDAVIAGGGDGTVSCAGALAWKAGKPLGVLPAGTMNFFARSLGMPLALEAAGEALAAGVVARCDIATANGRAFLHQFSAGFHPRFIRDRNRMPYNSRLGKIRASLVAVAGALADPPVFPVVIGREEGEPPSRFGRVSSVIVSNNSFGDGHLPYADRLDSGRLHLYLTRREGLDRGLRLISDLLIGSWRNNPAVDEESGRRFVLYFPNIRRRSRAAIDGELVPLEPEVELRIHPGALNVIVPARR